MKTRRDKLDDIFSRVIRSAAGWRCECCGKQFPSTGVDRAGLHCSHYMSRRHQATRFHPDNAFAHCFSCHKRLGENPGDFYRWYCEVNGSGKEELIRELAHTTKKRSPKEKLAMYQHYKQQLALIEQWDGEGKLPVEAWD